MIHATSSRRALLLLLRPSSSFGPAASAAPLSSRRSTAPPLAHPSCRLVSAPLSAPLSSLPLPQPDEIDDDRRRRDDDIHPGAGPGVVRRTRGERLVEVTDSRRGAGDRDRLRKLRARLVSEDVSGNVPNLLRPNSGSNNAPSSSAAHGEQGRAKEQEQGKEQPKEEEGGEPSWLQLLNDIKSHRSSSGRTSGGAASLSAAATPEVASPTPPHSTQTLDPREMLTDSYSRHHSYLRISLAERCNLRCRYCMPPEGVPLSPQNDILSDDEIGKLVELFVEGGVDKVRLTGGEPLLRPTLPTLISTIASHRTINSVGITTNGLTLSRQLPTLLDAGLTHANISLDTLDEGRFVDITRRKGAAKVLRAIDDAVIQFGERFGGGGDGDGGGDGGGGGEEDPSEQELAAATAGRVKINCVVMKGFNDDELRDFVMLTRDRRVDVRFIEWMPFNDNGWNTGRFVGYRDMMELITGEGGDGGSDLGSVVGGGADGTDHSRRRRRGGASSSSSLNGVGPLRLERLCDGPNDTTKWWRVPGHLGRVGFITSMSSNFCGTCNRLRITADGQLKVCLFGSREVSLRDAMRAGIGREDLALLVKAAVGRKTYALGGHGDAEGIARANDNRPMTLIGG